MMSLTRIQSNTIIVAPGDAMGTSPKSLMRMLGPAGDPDAHNLLGMNAHFQKVEGGHFHVQFVSGPAAAAA